MGKRLTKLIRYFVLVVMSFSFVGFLSSCASVGISQKEATIYVGETLTLEATSSDEDALVLWESSDDTVAFVRRGNVLGRGEGECYITAYDDNGASAVCKVTVLRYINLNRERIVLDLSNVDSYQLTTETVGGEEVTWSIENPEVATVNEEGKVSGLDLGETYVKATVTKENTTYEEKCVVVVKDSELPEDYYKLQQVNNETEVVAHPGVWSYINQGEGENVFSIPVHQNSSLIVKMSQVTTNDKPLKLRYQPGGADGSELTTGEEYVLKFDIKMNTSGKVYYGNNANKNVELTANSVKSVTFEGTVSSTCFAFSIKKITVPSGGLVINISNIRITKKGADPEVPEDYYEIQPVNTMSEVVANPGVWTYQNQGGAENVFETPIAYQNNGIVVNMSAVTAGDKPLKLRYQPGGQDGSGVTTGNQYTISMTVSMNTAGTLFYGLSGEKNQSLTANTPKAISYDGTIGDTPFAISIKKITVPSDGLTITISNITVVKKEVTPPPTSGYDLQEVSTESQVVANPGVWSYQNAGDTENVFEIPHYEDGTLTLNMTAISSSNEKPFKLRYQPGGNDGTNLVSGDKYTISFDIVSNAVSTVRYGNNANRNVSLTANVSQSLVFEGTVSSTCFSFSFKQITVPEGGISFTISNITIVKDETPQETPVDDMTGTALPGPVSADDTAGKNATVIANPGIWYYYAYITKASYYSVPKQNEQGGLTVGITSLNNENFNFRYQPGGDDGTSLEVGDTYTMTFTIKVSKVCTVVYGTTSSNSNGGNKSTQLTADTSVILTTNEIKVNASEPLYIRINYSGASYPLKVEISDITFNKVV